ncbi:MAG: hypothetical protein LQ340_007082 [Diploschistes diacapsis]|nr:MAG: hypothetical protein LQ340_007082 [Diploschistes diacapsis]
MSSSKPSATSASTSTPSATVNAAAAATKTAARTTQPATQAAAQTAASAVKAPAAWTDKHDAFVQAAAGRGEDKKSIAVLLETEYPALGHVNEQFVASRI